MTQRMLHRFALLVLGSVLVSAAVAAAANDGGPRTDAVTARFELTSADGRFRVCEGQDGPYREVQATYRGTASGDPRLTGDVEFTLERALDNRWVIRDADTGKKTATAEWTSVDAQDSSYGLALGTTRDGGDVLANQRVDFTQPGLVVQLGGTWRDNRTPALIASGRCQGKFTKFEFDLGGAAAATTAGAWVR
jgi:hypothetical protein